MINLLPSGLKNSLTYAHHNTKLVKIIIGLCIGIVGIIVIIIAGLFYMQQEVNSYKTSNKEAETALVQQKETETIARVQDISSSLKLAVNVLSQEILFSKLLRQVGSLMPPNTVLKDLRLTGTLEGGIELTTGAKDYNAATQIQVNLEQRPDSIFEKTDLVNIVCKNGPDADPLYPCQANLTAVFSKDNDFTLLKPQGAAR